MASARLSAAAIRTTAMSTAPSSHSAHDIKARLGHAGILAAARAASPFWLSLLSLKAVVGTFDRLVGIDDAAHEQQDHGAAAHAH